MKNLCKRGLAVLLAFAMCVGMLSLNAFAATVKCATCGSTDVYLKGDQYVCPKCDEYVDVVTEGDNIPCPHEKTFVTDSKDGTHIWLCTNCYEPVGKAKSHTYEGGKCTVCGAEEPKHEHNWSYSVLGGFMHTKRCGCGAAETEACNPVETTYAGEKVLRCPLCLYWEPVKEHTHTWDKWEPVGDGNHTRTCTDPNCKETQFDECHTVADDKGNVVCTVCGWVQYNDGISGGGDDKYCPDGEHVFGNTYQHSGAVHWQQCMNCPYTTDHEQCNFELEYKDGTGTVKAHVCSVCGNTIPVDYDDIKVCEKNPSGGHNWVVDRTELATDGKTWLTIVKCTYCGMEKVDGKCNSQEDTYTLTIKYEVPGGQSVFGDHVEKGLLKGATYNVPSPPLHGYAPEVAVVAGTISGDVSVTVKYSPIPYTWTIRYVDEEGNELHSPSVLPYTVDTVKSLSAPANPSIDGYKVKSGSVSAPDPQTLGNVESVVVYESTSTPDTDPEPTPTPSTDPEPTSTPEQTQPVDEETETENNEVDVDDPNVPLDENPVEIDDPEVPLAEKPEEPEKLEEMELEDPDTPLADVPQTGDNSHTWGILAALSGIGLMWLALLDKKNKDKAL